MHVHVLYTGTIDGLIFRVACFCVMRSRHVQRLSSYLPRSGESKGNHLSIL